MLFLIGLRLNFAPINRLEGKMKHNLKSSTSLSTGFKTSPHWPDINSDDIRDYMDMKRYRAYLAKQRDEDDG